MPDEPGTPDIDPTTRLAELLEQIDEEWDDDGNERPADLGDRITEAVALAADLDETGTRIGLTRRLAELAVEDDRPDDAYDLLEGLLHLDDAPRFELGFVHSAIARLARRISGIDVGTHLTAAVDSTDGSGDTDRSIEVRFELGEYLGSMSDNTGALEQFVEAQALARSIGAARLSARADDRIAAAHWELGRGDLAEEHLRRALAVARAADDEDGIAYASYRLAWCLADHSAVDSEDEALTLLDDCIEHFRAVGNLGRVAECEAMAARVHRANDDFDESIRLLRSAIAVHESLGAVEPAAIAIANLATDLEAVGQQSAAAHEYRRALALVGDDRSVTAKVTTRLALLLCALEQPGEAVELLEGVTEWFDRTDDAIESPRFHIAAARAHLDCGRLPHGRLHAQRALRCLAGAILPRLHAQVLELLGECDAREGDHDAAAVHYGQAVALWFHTDSYVDARRVARYLLPKPPTGDEEEPEEPEQSRRSRAPFIGMYL